MFAICPILGPVRALVRAPGGSLSGYHPLFLKFYYQIWFSLDEFQGSLSIRLEITKKTMWKFKSFAFFHGTLIPLSIQRSWIWKTWLAAPFFVQNVPILGFPSLEKYDILMKSAPWNHGDKGSSSIPTQTHTQKASKTLVFPLFDSLTRTDRRTDRWTDGPTDGQSLL